MFLQRNIYKRIDVIFSFRLMDTQVLKSHRIQFMMRRIIFCQAHKYSLDFCDKVDRTIPVHMYSGSFQGQTNAIIFHEVLSLWAICSLTCRIFRIPNDLSRFEQTSIIHTVLKTKSLRLKR